MGEIKVWKFVGVRKLVHGRWYYKGDTVEGEYRPSKDFVLSTDAKPYKPVVMKGKKKVGEGKAEKLRKELSSQKMGDLRKIGHEYECYDTKKSELVEEIINAKRKAGEL